ncbi:MAG TPA: hypothetical protein VF669_02260 [Tepidisphaeraceae bacterium]|jgi:hypothetical protein
MCRYLLVIAIRIRTARKIFRVSLAVALVSWAALCALHHGADVLVNKQAGERVLLAVFLLSLAAVLMVDHYHLQAPRCRAKRIRAARLHS